MRPVVRLLVPLGLLLGMIAAPMSSASATTIWAEHVGFLAYGNGSPAVTDPGTPEAGATNLDFVADPNATQLPVGTAISVSCWRAGNDIYGSGGYPQDAWYQIASGPDTGDYIYYYFLTGSTPSYQDYPIPTSIPLCAGSTPGQVLGDYVAMGDSYSAGESLTPYLPGTATATDHCNRSTQAYPELLDHTIAGLQLKFVACSGAVTQDFFAPNHASSEPAQISALSSTTSLVTFTIGGNDAGFADVVTACLRMRPIKWAGYNCSRDHKLVSTVNWRINALRGIGKASTPDHTAIVPVLSLLKRIHQLAPGATIEVGGYPHLFGSSKSTYQHSHSAPSKYACDVGFNGSFDYNDAQWLNSEADNLNSALSGAVQAAQSLGISAVYAANVPRNFAGHGLCDTSTAWLNGVHVQGGLTDSGSFHPNATGQANGYEPAFGGTIPTF